MPDDCMLFLQKNKDMFLSFFHGKMLLNLKSATHHVQHIYFLHLLHLCDNIIHRTFDDIIINLCKLLWRNRHSRLDPCNYNIAHGLCFGVSHEYFCFFPAWTPSITFKRIFSTQLCAISPNEFCPSSFIARE